MSDIFNRFISEVRDDGYFIKDYQLTVKVYSDKSLLREIKALNNVLQESHQKNKKLIWIAPFHQLIYDGLDLNLLKNLIWVSPVNLSRNSNSTASVIIDENGKLTFFLRDISKTDSFRIESHACFKPFQVQETIRKDVFNLIKNSAVRLKTIAHFSTIWENNFTHNRSKWLALPDILDFKPNRPDLFVLGGPSVDKHAPELNLYKHIWCADTALPTLLVRQIIPECVFSLDAGYGSYEHFITAIDGGYIPKLTLVLDALSYPPLYDLKFKKVFTCANSNPLVQQENHNFTLLENESDDVFGFMQAVYTCLFPKSSGGELENNLPEIFGRDGGHIKKATHLRGSAYHRRQYSRNNRLTTPEQYFYRLSSRYSRN